MSHQDVQERVRALDWERLNRLLLEHGYVVTPAILDEEECQRLRASYDDHALYRSTIDMKRYNFGRGSYRYFKYPLPEDIQSLRESFYEALVTTANIWAERSRYEFGYPQSFAAFAEQMRARGQTRSTPLILKYTLGDFNCLHQDLSHDLFFPFQVVFGLTEWGRDYSGGQLILTQQRPRMQSIPHIITIPFGAAVIFASNVHPQEGTRGYYRTVFKHGVGKIEGGERYTLGLVFHDYRETC